MNGACERAHATVDRMVEKILEDDAKIDLQKAVEESQRFTGFLNSDISQDNWGELFSLF